MSRPIRLGPARLEARDGEVRVSARASGPDDERELWFAVPAEHGDLLDAEVAADSFALVALLRAMRDGLPLHVEGPLSALLAYRLRVHAMPMLAIIGAAVPLRPVEVTVAAPVERPRRGTGLVTGLSAGVDSFFTLLAHLPGQITAGEEVTHLLFNNVGSHGQREEDEAVFAERLARATALAARFGLPLIPVNSNIDGFIGLKFEQTHTVRNAAVALLFQSRCRRMLYGSAYPYQSIQIWPTGSMAYADPALLPALSTEAMALMDFGTAQSRFEKIAAIVDDPRVQSSLDVCVRDRVGGRFINCGQCKKCVRTLFALEILGRVEQFAAVFDLDAWREVRASAIYAGLRGGTPHWEELRDAMVQHGHDPGGMVRQLSPWLPGKAYRIVQKVASRSGSSQSR
jgi:hypothetical protein